MEKKIFKDFLNFSIDLSAYPTMKLLFIHKKIYYNQHGSFNML